MYQALYRKWRPRTFEQVIGQNHITDTLKSQVESGRLSHAYIFIGTRGTGKTTCARILAKAVNCRNPVNGNPCGQCASCLAIDRGEVMDIVEMDAATNTGVDSVRALREEAIFSPAAVKKRVYIIDEVHMLSLSSFNALLKILEEPPEHLMFILATTEVQKVPATVLSRCQRHQFRRIDPQVIAAYLTEIAAKEGFVLTEDAAELIARLADGGVRDALSLLDQCSAAEKIDINTVYSTLGLAGNLRIAEMLECILGHDTGSAIALFSKLWMEGKNPASFLGELSGLLRDVLIMRTAPKGGAELVSGGYDMNTLKDFARRMSPQELICSLDTLRRVSDDMRDALSARTAAELCLVSLCDSTIGEDIRSLGLRVSRLEESLSEPRAFTPRQEESFHTAQSFAPGHDDEAAVRELEEDYSRRSQQSRFDPSEEDEDINPEQFAEPQPEKSLTYKAAATVFRAGPIETTTEIYPETPMETKEPLSAAEPEKPRSPESTGSPEDGELWHRICDKAVLQLPMEMRLSLGDESRVRGRLDGGLLRIQVAGGFLYNRFNRSEIIQLFSNTAAELCGHGVNVTVGELQKSSKPLRDLDELRKFPEITFK